MDAGHEVGTSRQRPFFLQPRASGGGQRNENGTVALCIGQGFAYFLVADPSLHGEAGQHLPLLVDEIYLDWKCWHDVVFFDVVDDGGFVVLLSESEFSEF